MSYCFDDLRKACREDWDAYVQHAFVRELAAGTLESEAFRHYLKQDYLFLIHFGRAYALATYKSRNITELRHSLEGLKTIIDVELGLHVDYCREWGISEEDLARLPEARATMAYTRYVLDTGNRGDLLDMHVALAPCLVGYGEISNWLNAQPFTVRGDANPYEKWLAMYESEAFQGAMRAEIAWLDERLASVTPERFAELTTIFRDATRLEIAFWQMGLDRSL
ncbi:thiaminase II [Marinimicrococcus flavescens]|uniref:Aminopyrimidine aminohydrolase n=1 Tax=Marinimicrococcus flavescens TaxID=3031815 RepID=A0AAP4D5Z9_9PROT|nr:thiaminase II [Marinimicrococcus flavescens]